MKRPILVKPFVLIILVLMNIFILHGQGVVVTDDDSYSPSSTNALFEGCPLMFNLVEVRGISGLKEEATMSPTGSNDHEQC